MKHYMSLFTGLQLFADDILLDVSGLIFRDEMVVTYSIKASCAESNIFING